MVVTTADFRKGLKIELDGEPFVIVDFQHVKPGKGTAFVRTRIKSLLSGSVLDKTYRSGEKFETPDLTERDMQCLYREGEHWVFMDTKTYDQVHIGEASLGEDADLIKEDMVLAVLFHGEKAIGITLPTFIDLKIVKSDPGVRGDTASGGTKPATLETGAVVQVPLFLNEGDVIRIDTRTRKYVERMSVGS